ncbi:hypothetical protein B9G55_21835 [Saccharibacillus sp. O16]|nr:hypothetical protein B9G55_21835 [Saccharibacillus sp. O16]
MNRNVFRRTTLAALTVLSILASGCGADHVPTGDSSDKQAVTAPQEIQSSVEESKKDILDPSHYAGSSIEPAQIELLNELFSAQNAGDTEAYAALFASDAPQEAKSLRFKVEQAELQPENDEHTPLRIAAAVQSESSGEEHAYLYTLKEEAGKWRIADLKQAQGPYAEESGYEGEASKVVNVVNQSTRYRNAGEADQYHSLFTPTGMMSELREQDLPIEELQVVRVNVSPQGNTAMVSVMQRYTGEQEFGVSTYALQKQQGKWLIADID